MNLAAAEPTDPLTSDEAAPVTQERVLVVIPTYNERDNIADLLTALLALPLRLVVIVVDDNSRGHCWASRLSGPRAGAGT